MEQRDGGDGDNGHINMFERLSVELLIQIASFLPFKETVRCSVLSTRWSNVWRETKNMEFDEGFFVHHDAPQEEQLAQREAFVGFVREFIANYPPQIDAWKFSLKISWPQDYAHDINQFIRFAVSRRVKHLELDFTDPTWEQNGDADPGLGFRLPEEVYQLENLKSLTLYWCIYSVYRFTLLQSLKTLSLGWFSLFTIQVRDLVASCPVLDTLRLKKFHGMDGLVLTTPNSPLKHLVVDNGFLNLIELTGPRLRKFDYFGHLTRFNMELQDELVEAHFDFGLEEGFWPSLIPFELMVQLIAVRKMSVCSVFLQIVPSTGVLMDIHPSNGILPVQHLTMNTALHANEFIGIKFMLAKCPNMNTLTLHLGPGKIFDNYVAPMQIDPETFWSHTDEVETCLKLHLRVVHVVEFRGTPNELKLIKYIMCYGKRLRRVNLYFPSTEVDNEENFRAFVARADPLMHAPRFNRNLSVSLCRRPYNL